MDTASKHLVIFDMDGVIMDVTQSYRESIRRTARHFFQNAPACDELPDPLFSLEDLAEVKQSGGLNNDWETTYRVIGLLLSQVHLPETMDDDDGWRLLQNMMMDCDLSQLISFLRTHSHPLARLLENHASVENPLLERLSSGDVGSGNIIKQIFQEIYLGKNLFETTYTVPMRTSCTEGLVDQEELMIDPRLLDMLSRHHVLAIATGRPKAEAEFPLNRLKIRDCFQMILTLDDCTAEEQKRAALTGKRISLSKPHPFMLDTIAQAFAGKVMKNYYLGDMPDDMIASRNARTPFVGVGVILPSPDKQRLKDRMVQAGADYVIEDLSEFNAVLSAEDR